jgi:hypothetical protein
MMIADLPTVAGNDLDGTSGNEVSSQGPPTELALPA